MNGFFYFIVFCCLGGFILFTDTLSYKTATGDPTPIQSTTKQLGEQIQNTFGNRP